MLINPYEKGGGGDLTSARTPIKVQQKTKHHSDFLPRAEWQRVSEEQPVLLPQFLLQLGLVYPQLADGRLHLLHLHLHQGDDVPLLVEFPQQLGGRGAGGQRVRVVQRAAGDADVLHGRQVAAGDGLDRRVVCDQLVVDRRGVRDALGRGGQLGRAQVLSVVAYLNHGDGLVARLAPNTGHIRRASQHTVDNDPGGRGGGHRIGRLPASAPPTPAFVHTPQREEGRDSDTVRLPAAGEVHAADAVTRGGLEGAEAAADPSPGDVPQPLLSQRGVFGKCVEAQVPVSVRVVVAARHTAGEARHGC